MYQIHTGLFFYRRQEPAQATQRPAAVLQTVRVSLLSPTDVKEGTWKSVVCSGNAGAYWGRIQGPGLSCLTAYWPCPGCWCYLWIPPLSLLKTLSQESWEIGFLLLFVCGGESCLPHCHFFILSRDICSWQLVGPCSRAASREICALMAPWTLALATHQLEVARSVYASALPIPGPLPAPVSLSCVVGS